MLAKTCYSASLLVLLVSCSSPEPPPIPFDAGLADVNGTSLFYEIKGAGEPIVFIEGGNLDLHMWDEQFDAFAENYRVMRYDVRGFGRSAPKRDPYLEHDDLNALLDYLSIESAYLVGLSMGGGIAIDFALAYPERVKALALSGPGLSGFQFSEKGNVFMQPLWDAMAAHDSLRAAELWLETPFMIPAMEQKELAVRLRRLTKENARVWIPFKIEGRLPMEPAIDRLMEVQAPTLVLVGGRDYEDIHKIADLVSEGIPGAEKVVLEGAGHMLNLERSEEFNKLVSEFISKY